MIDIKELTDLLQHGAWIVPLVTALVQVFKSTFENVISDNYYPLVSAIIGVGIGIVVIGVSAVGAFAGLLFGLAASGLYSLGNRTKNIVTGN